MSKEKRSLFKVHTALFDVRRYTRIICGTLKYQNSANCSEMSFACKTIIFQEFHHLFNMIFSWKLQQPYQHQTARGNSDKLKSKHYCDRTNSGNIENSNLFPELLFL